MIGRQGWCSSETLEQLWRPRKAVHLCANRRRHHDVPPPVPRIGLVAAHHLLCEPSSSVGRALAGPPGPPASQACSQNYAAGRDGAQPLSGGTAIAKAALQAARTSSPLAADSPVRGPAAAGRGMQPACPPIPRWRASSAADAAAHRGGSAAGGGGAGGGAGSPPWSTRGRAGLRSRRRPAAACAPSGGQG